MFVNGQPIKLKGVNIHEHNPETGHDVPEELMRKDFTLMKQNNINSVRLCHYPHKSILSTNLSLESLIILIDNLSQFSSQSRKRSSKIGYLGLHCKAKDAMKAEGHEIQDYQFLYPIPKTELERVNNEKLLWQNPGY